MVSDDFKEFVEHRITLADVQDREELESFLDKEKYVKTEKQRKALFDEFKDKVGKPPEKLEQYEGKVYRRTDYTSRTTVEYRYVASHVIRIYRSKSTGRFVKKPRRRKPK